MCIRDRHHPSWTALRSYAITAGLACLMGVSYELFVFPNAFAPAGINGLATMLQYLLHVNIGYLSLLINLPLVLLAWKKVDRDFARKTLVFVLVFSAVTLVLGQMDLSAIAYDSGSSAILGPVAAGVVSGAVYGWVIRQNGSTGGTDGRVLSLIFIFAPQFLVCLRHNKPDDLSADGRQCRNALRIIYKQGRSNAVVF